MTRFDFRLRLASHLVRGVNSITLLFGLATIVRALLITPIPLRALDHLDDDQAKMISVFMTYRHTSQLVLPTGFSSLPGVSELHHMFAVSATAMPALISCIKYVPRRL